MPTLYLVRHGRAAASWDADHDPGLDELGHQQARRAAEALGAIGRLDLIASPMVRTRETAAPLARLWKMEPRIEPRVSEIPSPVSDLQARGQWLREMAGRTWPALDTALRHWREEVLTALRETARDTVVVTHYIAINVAVGAATSDDRVVNFRPDHCSITILKNTGGQLTLVQHGVEGTTRVL
jgi:broad specificity phosphatase PhoE